MCSCGGAKRGKDPFSVVGGVFGMLGFTVAGPPTASTNFVLDHLL
jgi:hypothetical protein